MRRVGPLLIGCICVATVAGRASCATSDFQRDVAPILAGRCLECHSGRDPKGGLSLETAAGLEAGGDEGPAVSIDELPSSLLLQRVVDGEMPPESRGAAQMLPENEIRVLRAWIEAGAEWPKNHTLDAYEKTSHLRAGHEHRKYVYRPAVTW